MSKPTIYVAVPCYKHLHIRCWDALNRARVTCQTALVDLHYEEGDSMISRVRNNMISNFFFDTDNEWFMTVDSDIFIHQASADDNIFDRLLADCIANDLYAVGGLYSKKEFGSKFPCTSVPMDNHLPKYNEGIIEIQWLSSGCMLINRMVIDKMVSDHPELMYHGEGILLDKPRCALYQPGISHINPTRKKYLSEDWAICLRMQLSGFSVWADTSIRLTHFGECGFDLWPETKGSAKKEG